MLRPVRGVQQDHVHLVRGARLLPARHHHGLPLRQGLVGDCQEAKGSGPPAGWEED